MRKSLGGHDVAEDVVRDNFDEGISRVNRSLTFFDSIKFIDGSSSELKVVAEYNRKPPSYRLFGSTGWFEQFFKSGLEFVGKFDE
jgi:predicted ABC-type ATPase